MCFRAGGQELNAFDTRQRRRQAGAAHDAHPHAPAGQHAVKRRVLRVVFFQRSRGWHAADGKRPAGGSSAFSSLRKTLTATARKGCTIHQAAECAPGNAAHWRSIPTRTPAPDLGRCCPARLGHGRNSCALVGQVVKQDDCLNFAYFSQISGPHMHTGYQQGTVPGELLRKRLDGVMFLPRIAGCTGTSDHSFTGRLPLQQAPTCPAARVLRRYTASLKRPSRCSVEGCPGACEGGVMAKEVHSPAIIPLMQGPAT
jgi:hypothetical protein